MIPQHDSTLELELLAGAVAGRGMAIGRARHGVHTDGSTIFVGPSMHTGGWVQRAVIAQAALAAAGSFESAAMRRLSGSPVVVTRRYLGLEVVRACAVLDGILPRSFRVAVAPYASTVGLTGSVAESLRRAMTDPELDAPPEWFGEVRPSALLKAASSAGDALSDSEVTKAMRRAMAAEDDDDETDSGERSNLLEKLSSPLKSPLGSAFQKMLGARRSTGGGAAGSGTTIVQHRSGSPGKKARALRLDLSGIQAARSRDDVGGKSYPEWDHRTGNYREDWCTVRTYDAPLDATVVPPTCAGDQRLLRELSRLGLTWRPHDHELDGDELDLTALVDFRVGVAAGADGEPRVYRAERRTAQELSALVLLDATGSSAEEYDGKSAFDEQRDLAHVLTTALDTLGVRVATYAFRSHGRRNVRYVRCKTFQERWGQTAQRRLFSVTPSGFTRLGAAIRHGSELLETQAGTRQRLLIVVGDGAAYDDGYEGRYALEDSRRAVDEAGARAIGCVALSTRRSDDASAVWSAGAHRVTVGSAALAGEARDLFGSALRRAGRGTGTYAR